MRQPKSRFRRQDEKGSIAVETAICLPVLILFLAVPLYVAQIFWYYSVAQKAAHDGARFLSSMPQTAMLKSPGERLPAAVLAEEITHAEMADIKPGLIDWTVEAECDTSECGLQVPTTVRLFVKIKMEVPVVGSFAGPSFGDDGLVLKAPVTMRYVGN